MHWFSLSLLLHSLSSSPDVGLVDDTSKSFVGQFEQLLHQCHASLPFSLLYAIVDSPLLYGLKQRQETFHTKNNTYIGFPLLPIVDK